MITSNGKSKGSEKEKLSQFSTNNPNRRRWRRSNGNAARWKSGEDLVVNFKVLKEQIKVTHYNVCHVKTFTEA